MNSSLDALKHFDIFIFTPVEILQGLGATSAAFVGGFLAGSVLCAEALWMPRAVKSVVRILLTYCFSLGCSRCVC